MWYTHKHTDILKYYSVIKRNGVFYFCYNMDGPWKHAEGRGKVFSVEWCTPPLENTSKLKLHIEWLSVKSTWGLAEQLYYNQFCKEIYMELGKKGGEAIWSEPTASACETRRRGYHRLQDPAWGGSFKKHIRHFSPGVRP